MITKRRVFDDQYLPNRLEHRDAEVDQLARAFQPAIKGGRPRDVLVHGPSGVGKTVLARHTLERLERRADVATAVVRSLGLTAAGIYRSILSDLPGPDPAGNEPEADLLADLRERLARPAIVVLDEADGLPDVDALDHLADVDGLAMVVICHDQDSWLSRVDDDLRHRFVGSTLRLDRYGVDELADILAERARVGLVDDVVRRRQLETIADHVAGVARFGIQSLLAAAELAEERGHREIVDADVQDSFHRAQRRIRESNLASLPFHHQLLYELIRERGEVDAPVLQQRYDDVADDVYRGRDLTPIGKRARRNKLEKLARYDLVSWEGEGPHRIYWVQDDDVEAASLGALDSPEVDAL